ncbi:hypothetical protein B0H15DRAFT_833361 [Mycena belliarum]|uniref:Uncharacterized protein n=1 Tax=Mycena belliarum TaxID=1033014 RepID=A0AAD6UB17_9AGAR|nr:hypothetical protein B0H15DRAFT_833361 [Mycena belliae]
MTMRGLSALPLDDDLLDRVMTFCPTFGTLRAMVLVSKGFHRVFQTHPKSIMRAVAYNIVGPALPQALRLIRYPHPPPEDPIDMATTCPEDHEPSVFTDDEKKLLQDNAKVVQKLENIYSLTTKDRTSRTSLLTSEESWRFCRASYRIMLYCKLFPGNIYSFDELEDLDDVQIAKIRRQRTAVLNEYPTDELLEIFSVVKFIGGIFVEVNGGIDSSDDLDVLLSAGPAGAVSCWEDRDASGLDEDLLNLLDGDENNLFAGYFSLPFQNIWGTRNIKPPKEDEPASKYVLDQVNGANDTCSHCATPGGLALLTQANWDRQQILSTQLLKAKLKSNQTLTFPFAQAAGNLSDPEILGCFIAGFFAMSRRAPGFEDWEVGQSYCQPCLTKYLEEHAWIWWLQERVKTGWVPPEDCWYGYNCNTQTHKLAHAQQKNHLCVPTRGSV